MNRIRSARVAVMLALAGCLCVAATRVELKIIDRTGEGLAARARDGTAVDRVMIHFMSAVNLTPDDPYDVDRNIGILKEYGVSANYLIARDGTVYRLVPDDKAAAHAGRPQDDRPEYRNMNRRSIGIELLAVGSKQDMTGGTPAMMSEAKYEAFAAKHPELIGFTDAQHAALRQLLERLADEHEGIELTRHHVLGHAEYAGERKTDPGELFDWSRLGLTERGPTTHSSSTQ